MGGFKKTAASCSLEILDSDGGDVIQKTFKLSPGYTIRSKNCFSKQNVLRIW